VGEVTIYIQGVPDDLHRRFKVLATTRGESIKAAILRLMAEEVKRAEGKKR